MVAQAIPNTATLRVVPVMPVADEADSPTPIRPRKIRHTVCCQNELCKLPLCEITSSRDFLPLHANPVIRLYVGITHILCTCPSCGTTRTVVVR